VTTQNEHREALEAVTSHLARDRGLDLTRYKASYLTRRLLVRVRALRLAGLEEYLMFLKAHQEEIGPLQKALSIKVTGFFRNRSCFDLLEERVVPDLVRRAASRGETLAVWSAGCATGEEAWSLAALFASGIAASDQPGRRAGAPRIDILATDLDEAALAKAQQAVFPARALLAAVPEGARARFEVRDDGTATPVTQLRSMVRFERESLLDPPPRRGLDLVVCRNVLIYFSLEHQADILERFAAALRDGGYLVLGRVERLFGPARASFEALSARERVYQRLPRAAAREGAACA
jgi:two-component system CheB/CheR fusion protein